MKVLDAAQCGRIKTTPDGNGGVEIIGPRRDVQRIAKAVAKRERRLGRRQVIMAKHEPCYCQGMAYPCLSVPCVSRRAP